MQGSVRISAADADGEAESAFVYRLGCRSDPSPLEQKLLMREGSTKYALLGTARVALEGMSPDGGEYTPDPAFKSAPPGFLAAADALWQPSKSNRTREPDPPV